MFQPCPTRPFLPARHGVGLACVAFVATAALATRTQEVVISASRARFSVDDRFNPAASSTSTSVQYGNTSPLVGMDWHAAGTLNVYANLGTGFETPTLAKSAYRPGSAPGPNAALKASKSTQGEIGIKLRSSRHSIDAALLEARSRDEIVASQ